MAKSVKGEVTVEYITNWKELPIKTLARKMYNENVELFKDVEDARDFIRSYKGKKGKASKAVFHSTKDLHTEAGEEAQNAGIPNPLYTLPESDADEWPPYVLPKSSNRVLILSDVHIPYHNNDALRLAVEYGKANNANAVLLNGDIMDCYMMSRYEKDPRKRRFSAELEDTRTFLRWLHQELPNAKLYFKIGNHEERYEAFLRIKAPELLDISEFRLDVLLRFGELGIELITDKRIIKAGKLNIMHGHEFGKSVFSPVNPARGYYMRSKTNVLAGHNHRSSNHTEGNLNGEIVSAWSVGCLSELHPQYMPINSWNLGFAFVTVEGNGDFEVDNLSIIKGKVR